MQRYLLLAVAIAALSAPPVTAACNCQATRAQRWLAYKAYKDKIALERERLLAEQQQQRPREMKARRKDPDKIRGARRSP
jgi:hypothetical protein